MNTELFMVERRRVEQELLESEGRYERLLSATSDYIYTVAVEGDHPGATRHGEGCAAVTGYSSADFDNDPYLWFRVIYEQDRPKVLTHIEAISKGLTPPTFEHRIVHRNGEIRWISNTCIPHRAHDGHLLAYDGLITNITSRKRAELLLMAQFQAARILAGATEFRSAISLVLEAICQVLPWDYGSYWSFLDRHDHVRKDAEYCRPNAGISAPPWAEKLVMLGGPANDLTWFSDVRDDLVLMGGTEQTPYRSACLFTVRTAGNTAGAVLLCSRESQNRNEQTVHGLSALAAQLTQFIERRDFQEELQEERDLLRTLVDNMPDCIFVKDVDRRFVTTNPAMVQLLGLRGIDELLGKRDEDLFPADLAAQYRADEETVLASGKPLCNREELVKDHEGTPFWFLTTKVPLKDSNGKVMGLLGISRNITERLLTLQALRENQERLGLVVRASNTGIFDLNVLTGECYFSPVWKQILGYEEHEVGNTFQAFEELLHPEDRDRVLATYYDYLKNRIPRYELDFRLRHKDGTYRWVQANGVALRNKEGQPVRMAGSHLDITERKVAAERLARAHALLARRETGLKTLLQKLNRSHRDLQEAQQSLIQAAKFESVGTLAAGVAHEVKNPLQTMLMAVEYVTAKVDPADQELTQTLADMQQAIERANSVIRELLQFSANNQFKCVPGDLNDVIRKALSMVRCRFSATKVTTISNLAHGLPLVYMDANKIEQVFINLFINSLQAMPKGGELVIRTYRTRFGEESRLPPGLGRKFKRGDMLAVAEVQDSGCGLPENNLARLFDPFFTTKPPGVGTGLGLSVGKRIIDLHGGAIDLRNAPEGGALATIILKSLEGESCYGNSEKTYSGSGR